eukprot:scaffold57703_cov39-Tisochrysis_lutea.AAC.3
MQLEVQLVACGAKAIVMLALKLLSSSSKIKSNLQKNLILARYDTPFFISLLSKLAARKT